MIKPIIVEKVKMSFEVKFVNAVSLENSNVQLSVLQKPLCFSIVSMLLNYKK